MPTTLPDDISLNGLNFTRAQEGRALRAYQDSVGVWTIGYGLTNYDKNLPWKIVKGLTITENQAEWYLLKSLRENYLPACKRALQGGTYAHPQGALDGAADMHFNTGGISKATWPAKLGRGDLAGAKATLMSWNKAGGRVLSGLTRRRAGNWAEVSAGDYGHLTGPVVIIPNANNHETTRGSGSLLSAFPTDPKDGSGGKVLTHEDVPQPETAAPGVLTEGASGPDVTALQTDLTNAGFPVITTGTFDSPTKAAVRAFQRAHPNLTEDGKVGPATRATLKRAIDMRAKTNVIVKTAVPAIPGTWIAVHNFVGEYAGEIALAAGVGAVVLVSGYFLWKYRHDVHAWINTKLGRAVV